jgi:hypothetical protein
MTLLVSLAGCLVISTVAVGAYHLAVVRPLLAQRPIIATVSPSRITDGFVSKLASSGANDDEAKARAEKFGHDLKDTVEAVGLRDHVMLLVTEAVVYGADDYTDEVASALPADERP